MLTVLRLVARLTRWAAVAVVVAAVGAIVLAAAIEAGPSGAPRVGLFALGVTLSDPFVWGCVRNSLIQAGVVTAVSVLLGLALARTLTRWRFRGRKLLGGLLIAPAGLPAMYAALGLAAWGGLDAVSGEPSGEFRWLEPWNWQIGGGWLAWTAAGMAAGLPLVIVGLYGPLERLDPTWEDAGLAAGASRRRVWRTLIWPLVRARAWRSAALVYGWTLLDPGPPLVLGLRRTLAWQLVEATGGAVSGSADLARAGALGVIALAAVAAAHGVARSLGGRVPDIPGSPRYAVESARRRVPRGRLAAIGGLGLVGAALIWLPWIALGVAAATAGEAPVRPGPDTVRSVVLATLAVGILPALAALVLGVAWAVERPGGSRSLRAALLACPSLLLGVGLALVPAVLRAAIWPGASAAVAGGAGTVADGLDPRTTPGLALILGCTLLRLPLLAAMSDALRGAMRADWVEAARVMGASSARAWWDVIRPRVARPLFAASLLAAVASGLDLGAAAVLAPLDGSRPVSVAVLRCSEEPAGRGPAVILAGVCALAGLAVHAAVARPLARALLNAGAPTAPGSRETATSSPGTSGRPGLQ